MLEEGGSKTLLCNENWVSLWNEYLQSENILKWENHSLYDKYPLQTKWRNTCILWNNTICVRGRRSCTLFPYEYWITFWKEYCLPLRVFFFLFLLFYYSYVHTKLGSFLPPAPTPSLTTHSAPSLSPPPEVNVPWLGKRIMCTAPFTCLFVYSLEKMWIWLVLLKHGHPQT
jgi:hypothetical protein